MKASPSVKLHLVQVEDVDVEKKGLFAIIPAFNEEQVIGSVILQTLQHVERVIVVDDGSSDRTSEVAKLAGAEVIRLDFTTCKPYALLLGLRHVREQNCTVAIVLDANGQHNPMEIEKIAGQIINGKADLVIGSRYLNRHELLSPYETYDQLVLASGTVITDSTSSFEAFSKVALESLDFRSEGLKLNRDLITYFNNRGLKITEVPITLKKQPALQSSWDIPVKVLAAMPAYNEEKFIAKTILGAQKYVDQVLVVDDGSTDATYEIAQKLGAIVVRHHYNSGYGSAIRTIFEKAKELDVDALVIIDADGQHDPRDIQILLDRLRKEDVDVVIGSRFVQGNRQVIPRYRIFGMKVLDYATKIAGAETTTDSQSGFRAYGRNAIKMVQVSREGMSAGSEILIQIAENKLKVAEIPISVRYDIEDTSSQNPVKHGSLVLYNIIGLISYRRPLPAFGIPGFILVLMGLFFGSWTLSEYFTTMKFPILLSMISVLLLIMGLLLMIGALILNYLVVFVTEQKNQSNSVK
jgi:glycosyltransferase involved in cell wall biosynthesis